MSSAGQSAVSYRTASEADLVRGVRGGSLSAFEEIYRRYVRRIYNLVLRMVSPAQEAEDLTQEIFLQVFRNFGSFQERSSLYTWIYKIASNICLQFRKKLRRYRDLAPLDTVSEMEINEFAPEPLRSPDREAERRQILTQLTEAIHMLPAAQRLVIALGPIQGHDYQEMAHMLDVTPDVIKGRLHRARRKLHRAVFPEEDPSGAARLDAPHRAGKNVGAAALSVL